ncbi:hypothetical protein PR048_018123 [Dryococelus australis]|uniref:Proteasome assembly chaperone 1 n=1 Tax=Dryococelus australis TaxID=614101 RepID=A0ABQ9HBE2_9NEOP|nr:hypothetical protein PR048_018123 [Dryococelus australis]
MPAQISVKKAIVNICNKDQKYFKWVNFACIVDGEHNDCIILQNHDLDTWFDIWPGVSHSSATDTPFREEEPRDNFSHFVCSQVTAHTNAVMFCKQFLWAFHDRLWVIGLSSAETQAEQRRYYNDHNALQANMPTSEKNGKLLVLNIQNFHDSNKAPKFVYANLEALLSLVQTCQSELAISYTYRYQQHMPCPIAMEDNGVADALSRMFDAEEFYVDIPDLVHLVLVLLDLNRMRFDGITSWCHTFPIKMQWDKNLAACF